MANTNKYTGTGKRKTSIARVTMVPGKGNITVNGKDYRPYNTRDLSEYLEFVDAIGGKEENCKNVNYILWAYAYKDAGFVWGGSTRMDR